MLFPKNPSPNYPKFSLHFHPFLPKKIKFRAPNYHFRPRKLKFDYNLAPFNYSFEGFDDSFEGFNYNFQGLNYSFKKKSLEFLDLISPKMALQQNKKYIKITRSNAVLITFTTLRQHDWV